MLHQANPLLVRRGGCGIAADGMVAHAETWLATDPRRPRLQNIPC
jgi:hypothetical protein